MENYDRLHAGTRKLSPAVGFSWFYSSEPAPFSDDQSHLGAQWFCGRGPVRPSKLQGSGKDVVRAGALKDTALDRLGPHDHHELVSVVGWLEPGSHAAVVDPGNGIIAQSGRDVVLPKQKQKQKAKSKSRGMDAAWEEEKAVRHSYHRFADEEAGVQRRKTVCSKSCGE